ncbi:MAG: hypothetical protein AB7E60_15770 [Sphingobium sp.]
MAGNLVPTAMLTFCPGAGPAQKDPPYRLSGNGYTIDASFIAFILPCVFKDYRSDGSSRPGEMMSPADAKSLKDPPPTVIATA